MPESHIGAHETLADCTLACVHPLAAVNAIRDALSAWPDSFDGGEEELNGGDLLEWFSEWRENAKAAIAAPLTPASKARLALAYLAAARELLKQVGADRTVSRVRSAISSAKGAVRHAKHRPVES